MGSGQSAAPGEPVRGPETPLGRSDHVGIPLACGVGRYAGEPVASRVRRGVPVPAVAAYPDHRPEIGFLRPVAHVAHRPAGVHAQDGVAEAGVQAEDREPDPVQFGKRDGRGGAAVARRSRPGVPAVGVRQHAQPRFGRSRAGGAVMPWPLPLTRPVVSPGKVHRSSAGTCVLAGTGPGISRTIVCK